ncbi:hypothetical protein Bca52824_046721 [Brassica carinata]|uniref:Uncharacterized protein n=1 Tax=Brassica carinata TaxID=52824 RepID=A0A8X7UQG6_BRACI|nr:hypothetical protein Bca52824_046721 [Brassica carinata]
MKSGEAAVDKEDKIVVPPRKEPEATVLSDLLGTISSYQSKATFVAYKQCSGNKMDKILASHLMYQKLDVPILLWENL